MSRFTVTENIRRFRQLLSQPLDAAQRQTVEMLLVAEEAKLANEPEDDRPPAPETSSRPLG